MSSSWPPDSLQWPLELFELSVLNIHILRCCMLLFLQPHIGWHFHASHSDVHIYLFLGNVPVLVGISFPSYSDSVSLNRKLTMYDRSSLFNLWFSLIIIYSECQILAMLAEWLLISTECIVKRKKMMSTKDLVCLWLQEELSHCSIWIFRYVYLPQTKFHNLDDDV